MKTRLNVDAVEQEVRSFLKASQGQESVPIDTIAVQEERTEEGNDVLIVNITFAPSEQPLDPDQLADIPSAWHSTWRLPASSAFATCGFTLPKSRLCGAGET